MLIYRRSGCKVTSALRYTVDLGYLQTICAQNYVRLLKLMPGQDIYEYRYSWGSVASSEPKMLIKVIKKSPYTDILYLRQITEQVPWSPYLDMEVRLYHDADLAEVTQFQSAKRIPARNRYPNANMYHGDEKTQVNIFLAECLKHCLEEGYAFMDNFSEKWQINLP